MWWAGLRVSNVDRNGGNKVRRAAISEEDMTKAQ